tara:strand:+ start:1079 stop:1387 length:309 start_codon:yes stop_codon:yes gene_type:complete
MAFRQVNFKCKNSAGSKKAGPSAIFNGSIQVKTNGFSVRFYLKFNEMLMVVEDILARRTGGYLYCNFNGTRSQTPHSLVRIGYDFGLYLHEYNPNYLAALVH